MGDFWSAVKGTAESMGGAIVAPAGAVVDLAQMPFDDEDDDFGSVVHALIKRTGDVLDPVINPTTLTGGAVHSVLEGMNWAYKNAVDEPLAATQIAQTNAFGQRIDQALLFNPGALVDPGNWGKLMDSGTWAQAYDQAQGQSFGTSYADAALTPELAAQHETAASGLGVTADLATMFTLDPAWAGLKVAGQVNQLTRLGKLGAAQKANLFNEVTQGSRSGRLKQNLTSRTDKYLDWINGQNSVGRPLSAPEILHGTPELKRYATEPQVIAGLLADTHRITNVTERGNAQRRILAVAAGDTSQIARLRAEGIETASIADALGNMARQSTIDLKLLGEAPNLRTDPRFIASLEGQLKNLNSRGDIDKFIDNWDGQINQLLDTQHTLPNLPGVHTEGRRALNRMNQKGALRAPNNAAKALDSWASKRATELSSTSTMFQKGLHSVPIVAVKAVGLAASPWTKAPVAVSDALRQTHFNGMANLHDWGGATTQLDSMMRIAGVDAGERMRLLSTAFIAKNEPEKQKIIEQVEATATKALTRYASQRMGHQVHEGFLDEVLAKGMEKRRASLASVQGRAYAATEMPPAMQSRMTSAVNAEDAARMSEGKGWNADVSAKWRLDQINDDGTPLALPVLETQLSNTVPLIDISMMKREVSRNTGYLARLSKSWETESKELGRLTGLKAAGHQGLDRAIDARAAARDWSILAAQKALKVWKFSVLFRLGYPLRVLSDDHLRIWSQIGAGTFYGPNAKEAATNFKYNWMDRAQVGRAQLREAKVRRREILDELEGDTMSAHLGRQAELKSIEASIRGHQRSVAGLRKKVTDAETKASLGFDTNLGDLQRALSAKEGDLADKEAARDYLMEQLGAYSPDDLKRELEGIEAVIAGGSKSLRPSKKGIGSDDFKVADDLTIEGAFGGEYGSIMRAASSSGGTFDNLLQGAEERTYRSMANGSHRTIRGDEAGHTTAWADVLNNQFRTSPVAMHFINGGSVDDFVRWVKAPEQAELRRRLPHFAHDPEDWGNRVRGIVHDYIPSDDLRQAVVKGNVTSKRLEKMFADPAMRPAVHGRVAADNLGISAGALGVGKAMDRVYRMLGELPTDHLSRHPYFNSLYKQHAQDIYATRKAGGVTRFTTDDATEIARTARKLALKDLKSTLFDLSAHSHAAHVMRFISPFFGAHQEGISRWWRIAADNPQVVRRFTQFFDVLRALQIEVDENGELVKPGAPISREHRILLQLPQAFGGKDPEKFQTNWTINENAFNIVLQGGLTNPGTGPLVTVPLEWAAETYADDPQVARVARVFNPYPPNSPLEALAPATLKRLSATVYGKWHVDPSLGLGIGKREYNAAFSQHVQDLMVDFQLENGREPNAKEAAELVGRAGTETTTQMFHRFLWNSLSPAPAQPRSKYAAIQQGWYKISEQARADGKDFDWAYAQFKAKYGEAYMPLVYSTSNNPAWVDANSANVSAIKHYKPLLKDIDPALTRVVIGPYADQMIENNETLGEYSTDARNYLRTESLRPGDDDTYFSYDEPRQAAEEQMARRGWAKYGELTAALTAQAQAMGLNSYEESKQLVALRQAGVNAIKAENFAFDEDYETVDSGQYDRYIDQMRQVVAAPVLANDTERTDIKTLKTYLELRDFFAQVFAAREARGLHGPDAKDQAGVRAIYSALVGKLVESNTYFETYAYNGLVSRDPWLVKQEDATTAGGQ